MRRLLLFLMMASFVWAIGGPNDPAMVYEVRTAGSQGGGCFKEGATGTDFSQQDSPQFSFTDLASGTGTSGSPVVTSASHNFGSADVGNCINVTAGTNWLTGRYLVVSVSSNAATLDRTVGTSATLSGGTWKEGGAAPSLAALNNSMQSGNRAWVKADAAYVISSKVTFNYTSSSASWIRGYTSTRGDNGRATIQSIGSIGGDRLVDLNVSNNFTFANFTFDVNSDAGVTCLLFLGQPIYAENIDCKNFNQSTAQIQFNNIRGTCRNCSIHDGIDAGNIFYLSNQENECIYCSAVNITGSAAVGFQITEGVCLYCAAINLSGTNADGFHLGNQATSILDHSICYGINRDCVEISAANVNAVITNNIFVNAVNGINNVSGTTLRAGDILNDYNFTYNMSGAAVVALTAGSHSATLTGTPFTNSSTLDFSLNATAGAGAAVRAAGVPISYSGLLGTGYPDAGLFQHQDSGGGGAVAGSFVVAQ